MLNVSLCVREARCIKFFGERPSVGSWGWLGWPEEQLPDYQHSGVFFKCITALSCISVLRLSVVFPAAQYNMLLARHVMLM